MIQYVRHLDAKIQNHFDRYKEVLILLGARQVGKTTILKKIFPDAFYLSVDNETVRQNLERYDISVYKQILPSDSSVVVIDEIHLLSNPGRAAKIIYDNLPKHKLVITGSSALSIKNRSAESLAGRKIDYHLYPLTFSEYLTQKQIEERLNYKIMENIIGGRRGREIEKVYAIDINGVLSNILLYGLYPAILDHPQDSLYLKNLIDSVIFKDILDLSLIENRSAALNLLRLLAYQIGSLVNFSELASRLSMDVKTVKRYINIFEQSFIIFSLYPYARKGRDEIGKMPKIYFYDTGLRNALIDNFQPLSGRDDLGMLFENFIISEVKKINYYGDYGMRLNFWRTKQGAEVDLVMEDGSALFGVEIKSGESRANRAFANRYPNAKISLITPNNFY